MIKRFDVVVVGAGFAGLYMLHRLRKLGLSAIVLEAGSDIGGTWYWNRYPGARCDVPSLEYQYGFDEELQREWTWTERYAAQPEILKYIHFVADRLDLRRDVRLDCRVRSAIFDESEGRWTIATDTGEAYSAQYCVMATGSLSASRIPDFEGLADYRGETYHTGTWPDEGVDFAGKRVGVIGTGSSGVQSIPLIAQQAEHLYVFQRTPGYSLPAANRPLTEDEIAAFKANFAELRQQVINSRGANLIPPAQKATFDVPPEEREAIFARQWFEGGFAYNRCFTDQLLVMEANEEAANFAKRRIREKIADPELADQLTPDDHPIGTKRLCLDTGYFETFNRPNVSLVNLREGPIERLTPTGLVAGGKDYPLDAIVFATGFDAMTGALSRIDIRGRGGHALSEHWAAGPRTYIGLCVAGFPNMFLVAGSGSPSVFVNVLVAIEQHVEWIADCLEYLGAHAKRSIEATEEAEADWVAHSNELAANTLYPRANSWYIGANVPGKPRVFMPYAGGFNVYRDKTMAIAAAGYTGFRLD